MTDKIQLIRKEIERLKDCVSSIVVCKTLLNLIDSLPEEPVSEDLEEEIKNYIQKEYPDGIGFPNVPKIARNFAEWQKQQMMKDAVEADVVIDRIGEVVYLCPHLSEKLGDKVKIIICKTEQQ